MDGVPDAISNAYHYDNADPHADPSTYQYAHPPGHTYAHGERYASAAHPHTLWDPGRSANRDTAGLTAAHTDAAGFAAADTCPDTAGFTAANACAHAAGIAVAHTDADVYVRVGLLTCCHDRRPTRSAPLWQFPV